jgi:hypothetical protein
MNMENHGGIISAGEKPHSSTVALCLSCQQSSLSKAEGTGEGNDEFGHKKYLCSYFEGLYNAS